MEQNNNNEQNAFDTETHYGKQRAAELRAGTKYFSKLSSYENFILSQGWRYPTEKAAKSSERYIAFGGGISHRNPH